MNPEVLKTLRKPYLVFYRREPTFHIDEGLQRDEVLDHLTHMPVALIYRTGDMDRVFEFMQGENWQRYGLDPDIIPGLGLHHTSMSVGDCIQDLTDGRIYQCANFGWEEVA